MKSHVDRQYLKICNATFKRIVSLFYRSKALTRKFFPNYNLAMVFCFHRFERWRPKERRAVQLQRKRSPEKGMALLYREDVFIYGPIWNYIQYVTEENFHSITKPYQHTRMLTLALHRPT